MLSLITACFLSLFKLRNIPNFSSSVIPINIQSFLTSSYPIQLFFPYLSPFLISVPSPAFPATEISFYPPFSPHSSNFFSLFAPFLPPFQKKNNKFIFSISFIINVLQRSLISPSSFYPFQSEIIFSSISLFLSSFSLYINLLQ